MGGIVSSITGKGGTGGRAAGAANVFAQQAIGEQRRQFDITQANIDPFIQAGTAQLPALTQGTTAAGLDERLAEIFGTEAFEALRSERTRAIEGQLAAGGLTRSGTAIQQAANIPASLGLAIEELLTGRSAGLATGGLTAATGLGAIGQQTSGRISDVLLQQGQNVASGILTDQQARAKGAQNIVSLASTAASIFFSDPTLKENVEQISTIGDLNLYEWDWIEGAKGTMIEGCSTMGFMADEVKEKYPQHVSDFCGFMIIDYPALLDELEHKEWLH